MISSVLKRTLLASGVAATTLLLASGVALAQSNVTLTAKPSTTTLPDGQSVPMWGYACDSAGAATATLTDGGGVASITVAGVVQSYGSNPTVVISGGGGSGAAATATAAGTTVTVTVSAAGSGYTFAPTVTLIGGVPCTLLNGANPTGSAGWQPPLITVPSGQDMKITLVNNLSFGAGSGNQIPTSLVIVGQLGGGLGNSATKVNSPTHAPQGTTWPGTQGPADAGSCTTGNGGDTGTFCPPGQPQRVRTFATEVAAGGSQVLTWTAANLRPGTYLMQSGTQPSIQGPMGLYGVLVVTDAGYPGTFNNVPYTFDKDVALLLSEIDPVQNREVDQVVRNTGFSDATVWSGQVGACGDATQPATARTCYPPAVNYDPRYFLINGVSFDRGNVAASALAVNASPSAAGRVLLRFVNAGSRMHVPSVVGPNANMSLLAEDGNKLPGLPKVQNSLFLAAGKTYDVTIEPTRTSATGPYAPATYAVFDRALALSTNNQRDGGMQVYIKVAGGAASGAGSAASGVAAKANPDTFYVVSGNSLVVSDPARGVIANDVGIYGVAPVGTVPAGLTLSPNGTFSYSGSAPASFQYCGNGAAAGDLCTTVTLSQCTGTCLGAAPTARPDTYASNIASRLQIGPPGVLANDSDPSGLPLKAGAATNVAGGTVTLNQDGSFVAVPSCAPVCPVGTPVSPVTFQYTAINSQNTLSTSTAQVTVNFGAPSGLVVRLFDGKSNAALPNDYRWIIEEDRTINIDPTQETNGPTPPTNVAVNFHISHTPVVAQGCVGTVSCEDGQTLLGVAAACDVGNGTCRTDASHKVAVRPSQIHLDPTKRYYLSVLPADAVAPIVDDRTTCVVNTDLDSCVGHGMGGARIAAGQTSVDVYLQPTPLQPAKISVFVFQDDNPLNGENDTGGGIDVLAPNEPGLGGFNIVLLDQAGALGDSSGQITYDMFGMPVSNALANKIDPATGFDACAISPKSSDGLVGVIVTCPTYEVDPRTGKPTSVLSPLAGHALIDNLYAGLYEVVASPGADRFARGEEWLQTNTLDGTKPIEAFIKPGEPGYFQEFGPGGYHVAVGFANPAFINGRKGAPGDGKNLVCSNQACDGNFYGRVTGLRMSRTPDQRVYSSGSYDMYSFTQCYVSLGAPDSADFAFTKCDAEGKFDFTGIPTGNYRVTVFDQWNDLLVDGLATGITTGGSGVGSSSDNRMQIAVTQWRQNLYGRVFIDQSNDGVSNVDADGNPLEPGLPLVPYNLRYRDGSYAGFNNTDMNGFAGFNEVFPFLNWLVVDIDSVRYKLSKIHVVYDSGGPVDGTTDAGSSGIAAGLANTIESASAHLPPELRVPGAIYCDNADCTGSNSHAITNPSTGRVDPGWVTSEGWMGMLGNNGFIEFAMRPFKPASGNIPAENGGIKGHVIYASTRPFDDPALLLQLSWEPGIANVRINLYQKTVDQYGNEKLNLVDTTETTSFDDYANGFRKTAAGGLVLGPDGQAIPNMSCPGQEISSPFYFTLQNSTFPLNPTTPLSSASRFKCYDGWAMFNQIQPAPYNGMYKFPSIVNRDATTGAPIGTGTGVRSTGGSMTGTNCTICVTNPDDGTPMLPAGKYVVEVIVPPGYELVKEEDKNILLGDAYVAPVTTQFAGFGNIYIMPDQAAINAFYNPRNAIQSTSNNGAVPRHEGDTGSIETFWPCVGAMRTVPDLNSLYPGAGQQAPFAGASRPLCDRKEVTLRDEMMVLAKFYLFSSTHIAAHFTGTITNDFASEFDPFSPQFGEKFAVPNTPVAFRDFAGREMSRVYSDQWGAYNGTTFSTWTVFPPSPSGYIPQMMIACMNDPGPILDTRQTINGQANPTYNTMITDPAYNPAYSNFCYEWPFMPGQTAYMDTPVIPTMSFAAGYNLPDCEYPDATPAIASVVNINAEGTPPTGLLAGRGPWVTTSGAGHTLRITALGNKPVLNNAYTGPQAQPTAACPNCNQKYVTRHYGFGTTQGTGSVTIGGIGATVNSWSDSTIEVTVPANVPLCSANNESYGGTGNPNSAARCGQLVVTAGNGKQSIDAVTVTIGGTTPKYVAGENTDGNALQLAIDNATPGDLILIAPGTYKEMLLMWKPVRLQGVGAASVTINADAHPAGKLDPWRKEAVCVFGLTADGRPTASAYPGCSSTMLGRVDRIPLESIIGWDTTGNGNLAQQLQEPTLMGAYEGAGITVLGRGIWIPTNTDRFGVGTEGAFPAGYRYLNASRAAGGGSSDCRAAGQSGSSSSPTDPTRDFYTSNFRCNPSRIDGVSITNSSQGGGAIFAHGWNHNLEIANTRIFANHGTLTGGITIGNGEFPDPFIIGSADNPPPTNLPATGLPGQQVGYGFNRNVTVHNNAVVSNASIGDALYSGTPAAAGGVTFCPGADGYKLTGNWICGNLSTGDAGGVAHVGFINDGLIQYNRIVFNQAQNSTIPVHGGGLAILGASPDRTLPDGTECGSTNDADCPPGLSEGTGRNLKIDGNLILGNSAESGSGGGLRLQMVNGQDVIAFPLVPGLWNDVSVTNNIIANNVAGWDGGGVSMQDALRVSFINNTVISNDTTASAGVLFNTIGAPLAAVPPPNCVQGSDPANLDCSSNPVTTSTDQPAGLVTMPHTPNLVSALPPSAPGLLSGVNCPVISTALGGTYSAVDDGNCRRVSLPVLANNIFWQNRAFHIGVGPLGGGQQNQQAVVTLYPSLNQASTGFCVLSGIGDPNGTGINASAAPVYWDIGVRGDSSPTTHDSGFTLSPSYSILSSGGYTGSNNQGADPAVVHKYCNGSRLPPEGGGTFAGFNAPPGRSETTGLYPVFALNQITPAATVDEGNNWINLSYGPLSLSNPVAYTAPGGVLTLLGDYAITPVSPARDAIPLLSVNGAAAPGTDFFGRARKQSGNPVDIGAVELFADEVAPPTMPTLGVLDDFNRANATTLGANWSQLLVLGAAAIRVNTNQAFANTAGNAYWNVPGAGFAARQAAAFTIVNTTLNGDSLILKATGTTVLGVAPNFIRVNYTGGTVVVTTTQTGGLTTTSSTTLSNANSTFGNGDTLTAMVDQTGTVFVWKNTTFVGSALLPNAALWTTGGGRIGIQLPVNARVDNFAGGTVP